MKQNTERKKLRRDKQLLFQEELLRKKRFGKNKVCQITKGEHVYNELHEEGWGRFKHHTLICKCGKRRWSNSVPNIYPIETLPKFSICKKHGYIRGENETCWACTLDFDAF